MGDLEIYELWYYEKLDPYPRTRRREAVQELTKFANLAFGPKGIPELQILAWGDFSHDGRWENSNVLLCKNESTNTTEDNFRIIQDSDSDKWDLIHDNMDMLSACSPDQLFWKQNGDEL